jgi:hypothetical protein
LPNIASFFSSDQVGLNNRWAALKCSLRKIDTFIGLETAIFNFLFNFLTINIKQKNQILTGQPLNLTVGRKNRHILKPSQTDCQRS